MTTYAYDESTFEVLGASSSSCGAVSSQVALVLNNDDVGYELARLLNDLSAALWTNYARQNELGFYTGTDGVEMAETLAALDELPGVVATAGEKGPDGAEPWLPASATAQAIGHLLHSVPWVVCPDETVVTEVRRECDAVASALAGDFSDRAVKAASISRACVIDRQLDLADVLFANDPTFPGPEIEKLDPTSAAVAAGWWLWAAAIVAAEVVGCPVEQVVLKADEVLDGVRSKTPTRLLAECVAGESDPRDHVVAEVFKATELARGRVWNAAALIKALKKSIKHLPEGYQADMICSLGGIDITRPAPDLLAGLLSGIDAAWDLFDDATGAKDLVTEEQCRADLDRSKFEFVERVRAVREELAMRAS